MSGAPATIDWMVFRVLGSAAGEFRDVLRAATPTHRRLRDHLVTISVATVGVDLFCAIAAFLLERHSEQTEIKTFGSAVFWTTTQLLTVSSQIKNPISVGGRILDVFMEIWAVTVVAALAGAFGTFLQKRGQEMDEGTDGGTRRIPSGWPDGILAFSLLRAAAAASVAESAGQQKDCDDDEDDNEHGHLPSLSECVH
jgi:hypothetical protein